jgi:DNA-binding SARP family transcriptional activator/formylglycine-generating enzyme required for sulfatase activity
MGLFWPESTQDQARHALSQALHVLRQQLGEEAIVTRGEGEVALNQEAVSCDVWAFEAAVAEGDLDRAVALYRGPLLHGVAVRASAEFDHWMEGERDRLARSYARALEQLAEACAGRGEQHEAVVWWRRLVAHDPYSTHVTLRLMQALEAVGDRAGAVAQADRHAEKLQEDLDAEPSPDVAAYAERLRRQPVARGERAADPLARLQRALAHRYTIERELGSGGMATVYLAQDVKHERQVAVKVVRPALANALGAERFLQEIKITANLHHPHILPLLDSGETDGFLYYVMPYVEGESLRDRLSREKQLPVDETVKIAFDVAEALEYAHGHNVIHRDVKPENIMLEAGHAVVADFGIARAISKAGGTRLTETGIAVGTPAYMSPEQASGVGEADPRSDLYALGCVVYEMLAGDPPFIGSTPQGVLARKSVERAPPLRPIRETLPPPLEEAVLKALARLPADRFATVMQFADALAETDMQRAWPDRLEAGPVRELVASALRHRWIVIAGLAGTIGVATVGVRVWAHQSRVGWARTVALPEATRLVEQGRTYEAFRLLREAERHIADDPILTQVLIEATTPVTVRTTPPGADVYARDYRDEPEAWELLGSAPLEDVRLPVGTVVLKISLDGFQTREVLAFTPARTLQFVLQPAADSPAGMVHVPGGRYELYSREVDLDDFWIDRHEVTNHEFKTFVDGGGYERPEYWIERLVKDGEAVSWENARQMFRDRTGRPGPATWEVGAYPEGWDDYPVGGVSWHEAAAYCASVGKQLPTVYHWYRAAEQGAVTEVAEFSNFAADGPAKVGHPLRLGVHGTYDMAGNVKEWTWNGADATRRYILGGGWHEPSYQYHKADAQSSWDRELMYGVFAAPSIAPSCPRCRQTASRRRSATTGRRPRRAIMYSRCIGACMSMTGRRWSPR